ncbi:MAG: selenocysteine-specific translation elongation factor [Pirellula sp.]
MTYTIVGVTGHIDHGKTTLVRLLTGVDTDSLPEEKRRGITIDLGFASYRDGDHQFALIDAPGHQKYIGNLLAGVSSIDVGLLVVACDQGIQEQTLEHASILRGLGLSALIVVISKADLVKTFTIKQLSEELEFFLSDLGFSELPIVPVSCVSGDGIAQLKSLLCQCAIRLEENANKVFAHAQSEVRIPIDRVFKVEGRGLVVAGSLWSGKISVGDTLQRAGTNDIFRVREMEVHGESVESSKAGMRTAINLVGPTNVDLCRGDELVSPGSYHTSDRLVICLEVFSEASEIRCPCKIQLHTATHSCSARILGLKSLVPGTKVVAIVNPEEPIVATLMQACLFRCPYPVGSFASGRVMAAIDSRRFKNRDLMEFGKKLIDANPSDRLLAWVELYGELEVNTYFGLYQVGVSEDELAEMVTALAANRRLIKLGAKLISVEASNNAKLRILKILKNRKGAEQAWISEKSLLDQTLPSGTAVLIAWGVEQLITEGKLVRINGMIALGTEGDILTNKQRRQLEVIIALFEGARMPPTMKEISASLKLSSDAVSSLIRFAVQRELLIDLGNGFCVSTGIFRIFCRELFAIFTVDQSASVSCIRDRLQLTRKYVIPLLEYCDRVAITVRKNDHRNAGLKLLLHCDWEKTTEHTFESK